MSTAKSRTAAAAAPKRLARALDTLLAPPQIHELFLDATRHRVEQGHRGCRSGRRQEARRPRTEVVGRILARQRADEIGPFVIRIAKGIGVRPDLECIVGQRRLYVLEGDRAVETKLGRRFVKGCDGHRIVEDVVKPPKVRRARQDIQLRADEPEIVTLARPKHHAMLAKSHRFRISVGRDVPHGQKAHVVPAQLLNPAFSRGLT